MMKRMDTNVRAHPADDFWLIECSECGPLGLLGDDVDDFCRAHIRRHATEKVA